MSDNTDTSSGEFSDGGDGALFGDTGNSGSTSDYASWNWHQIEAAIDGGSMMTSSDDAARAAGIASPQSLWSAGTTFYSVQQTLAMVADSISAQANALAGNSDSPWMGDAATAFMTMMTGFSNNVTQNVNVLSGGAMGFSIPDQLTENGNYLAWAQSQIESIDEYYAQVAEAEGAHVINGLVQVHEKPELVTQMTDDMRNVLNSLVVNYTDTINNIKSPTSASPPPPGTLPPPPGTTPPPGGDGSVPPPGGLGAPPPPGGLGSVPPPGGLGTTLPPTSNLSVAPPPGGVGSVPPPSGLGAPPLPGGLSLSPPLGGAGVSPPPMGNLAMALPPGSVPGGGGDDSAAPFSASAPPPSDTSGFDLPLSSSVPALGAPDPAMDAALNPPSEDLPTDGDLSSPSGLPGLGDDVPPASDLPGMTTPLESSLPSETQGGVMPPMGAGAPGGVSGGEPSDASGLLSGDAAPFTGVSAPGDVGSLGGVGSGGGLGLTGDGVPSAGGDLLGAPAGVAGGESPMMPMMPPMGAGAPGGVSGGEPSDASGLLSGDAAPFTGVSAPGDVGSLGGVGSGGGLGLTGDGVPSAGGDLLGAPAGVAGGESPMMPMMPPMGAGAPGGVSGGEPSDASGLLSGTTEPWEGGSTLDEVGATTGVGAGGDELAGVEPAFAPEAELSAAAAPANAVGETPPMMPMMPGMGAGGSGASSDTDRADASGLLEGGVGEWASDSPGDEVGSLIGAEAAAPATSFQSDFHDDDAADAGMEMIEQWTQPSAAWSQQLREGDRYEGEYQESYFDGSPSDGNEAESVEADEWLTDADHTSDEQVPVIGQGGTAQDPSDWETAGAAADVGLFTLGLWAARRRQRSGEDDEDEARIVSGDEGGWVDSGIALSDDGDEPDGLPGVATWRPIRSAESAASVPGAAEGRLNPIVGRRRLGRPPEGYDPEAASAAAEAEAEAPALDEELPARSRGVASLLVQDPDMWGSPRADWDLL